MSVVQAADRIAAQGNSAPQLARDPVNQAMVNNWVEAMGDANPAYTDSEFAARSVHGGLVAPPAMAQVWTMRGLHGTRTDDDPLGAMMSALDAEGFTSVVATNSEQTYHRYLRPGEQVAGSTRLESVVGPKRTALGEGWFVTTRTTWTVDAETVAEMTFRVLKFRPPGDEPRAEEPRAGRIIEAPEYAAGVLRPVISADTAFFWEGLRAGELRIQRWGSTLRHPPGPVDPGGDLTARPDYVVARGTGTVYSYVVHHHPQVPGKRLPFVVALVELDEGVRVLGEVLDVEPDAVRIGLPVRAVFLRVDDELTLPAWEVARGWERCQSVEGAAPSVRGVVAETDSAAFGPARVGRRSARVAEIRNHLGEVAGGAQGNVPAARATVAELEMSLRTLRAADVEVGTELPELVIEATPTFIVSSALATRDFQDVHHDRDAAVARGSKDIFLNILTDNGLVQRYVTDWAGPEALVRSIKIKLGVPCYAYDSLTFSGRVTDRVSVGGEPRFAVAVTGRDSLGDHVTGTVEVVLP